MHHVGKSYEYSPNSTRHESTVVESCPLIQGRSSGPMVESMLDGGLLARGMVKESSKLYRLPGRALFAIQIYH